MLGYGSVNLPGPVGGDALSDVKYLYDTKTQSLTNLTSLIDSMNWFDAPTSLLQLDNQGRILTQEYPDYLLLTPQGVSADPIRVPEPESWAVFATLIGGLIAHKRLRFHARS